MAQFNEHWAQALADNPPPSWGKNPRRWPNKVDPASEDCEKGYGYTVFLFAERWADEMERRFPRGPDVRVADVAEAAARVANRSLGRWGITGYQYGVAVAILARAWLHGEALRRWHNLDTQLGTEGIEANRRGGVLNPALLRIGHP